MYHDEFCITVVQTFFIGKTGDGRRSPFPDGTGVWVHIHWVRMVTSIREEEKKEDRMGGATKIRGRFDLAALKEEADCRKVV